MHFHLLYSPGTLHSTHPSNNATLSLTDYHYKHHSAQLSEYIDSDQIPADIVDTGKRSNVSSEKASSSTHSLVGMDTSGSGSAAGGGGVKTAAGEAIVSKPSATSSTTSSIPTKSTATAGTGNPSSHNTLK